MRKNGASPYLQWYQQNKVFVWGAAAAAAVTLYATYRATSAEASGARKKQRPLNKFQRAWKLLNDYSTAASALGDSVALISTDLQTFLTSDATELPQSLRQLNKLLRNPDVQDTVSACAASVARGVASAATTHGVACSGPALVDTLLEAVLSERGRGLIGMAVGVATRNAAVAVCEFIERRMEAAQSSPGSSAPGSSAFSSAIKDLLRSLSSGQGEQLLALLLTKSVRAAVTSYMDATSGSPSLADGLLAAIGKRENRDALTELVGQMAGALCREMAAAYRSGGVGGSGASQAAAAAAGGKAWTSLSGAEASVSFLSSLASRGCGGSGTSSGRSSSDCSAPSSPHSSASSFSSSSPSSPSASFSSSSGSPAVLPVGPRWQQSAVSGASPRPSPLPPGAQHLLDGADLPLGSLGPLAGGLPSSPPVPPAWVWQAMVEALRVRELRSLALEVVCAASREGTRGAVQGLLQGSGIGAGSNASSSSSGSSSLSVLPLYGFSTPYKMYVLATVAVSLCTYALSPRAALLL